MKKTIPIYVCVFWALFVSFCAAGVFGHRGDLMLAYSPMDSAETAETQAKFREFNETLFLLNVPQHVFGSLIIDQSIIEGVFMYHTEILAKNYYFDNLWGYSWRRYRFTDTGKEFLDPGQAGDLYHWIASQTHRYKLPFEEAKNTYKNRIAGLPEYFLMSGYDQSVADYTNFADFYGAFMNKHHYCITATNWAIYKAIYDKCPWIRQVFINALSDPHAVQAFDTLTAGRLLGFLIAVQFIEEY